MLAVRFWIQAARPCARGRMRHMLAPSSTKIVETTSPAPEHMAISNRTSNTRWCFRVCRNLRAKFEPLMITPAPVSTEAKELNCGEFGQRYRNALPSACIRNINPATKTKKPYLRLMIHKHSPEKSKLIIEQKVNGHWVDKVINLSREKFRTAVMITLEMTFGYAEYI